MLTTTFLAVSMVIGQAENTASDENCLKEYGAAVVGTWTGEGTLKGDLPGIGEKGQHIKGQATTKWVMKKTALQCDWRFGKTVGKWVAIWGAEKDVIRAYFFNSSGNFAQGTIAQKDGKWTSTTEGASGEGKPLKGVAIMTISDGGDTITWDETEQVVGDEKITDFRHVWKRKTKK